MEVPLVARQPRQQAGTQERRLAGPGRSENDEQALIASSAHAAEAVEPLEDLNLAAEENRRIIEIERLEPTIRRP